MLCSVCIERIKSVMLFSHFVVSPCAYVSLLYCVDMNLLLLFHTCCLVFSIYIANCVWWNVSY